MKTKPKFNRGITYSCLLKHSIERLESIYYNIFGLTSHEDILESAQAPIASNCWHSMYVVCSPRKRCNLTYVSQLSRLFPWLSYAFPVKRLLPKLRTEKNGVEYDDTSYNPLRAPHGTLWKSNCPRHSNNVAQWLDEHSNNPQWKHYKFMNSVCFQFKPMIALRTALILNPGIWTFSFLHAGNLRWRWEKICRHRPNWEDLEPALFGSKWSLGSSSPW